MTPKRETLLVIGMALDETNEEVIDYIRTMKTARENGVKQVVCLIDGFNDDSRPLYAIPEARALCRRLVNLGFISYLNVTTAVDGIGVEPCLKNAWGALEIYLCGEGKMGSKVELTTEEFKKFTDALDVANEKANQAVGEYVPPTE